MKSPLRAGYTSSIVFPITVAISLGLEHFYNIKVGTHVANIGPSNRYK